MLLCISRMLLSYLQHHFSSKSKLWRNGPRRGPPRQGVRRPAQALLRQVKTGYDEAGSARGRPFRGGVAGMCRFGAFFHANAYGGRKTPVSPNPTPGRAKRSGKRHKTLAVPASLCFIFSCRPGIQSQRSICRPGHRRSYPYLHWKTFPFSSFG